MSIKPNQRVRLIGDPGRVGIFTGRTRMRGGVARLQVRFPDSTTYAPSDQLEPVEVGHENPLDLLEAGRIGRAIDLRRALTHVRLAGRLADILYSLDTTGTDFYAYQFKPVVKLLNSATPALLCADEVGLGKTIEAGLIWTELRTRFEFGRLLVLCPAMLREKWQTELRNRFGVRAEILDAKGLLRQLHEVRDAPEQSEFAAIGSLQGLRPRRGWKAEVGSGGHSSDLARFLDEVSVEGPLIDLLVVDEAHYLRNPQTVTHQLGRLARSAAHYAVFLSATPIHLRSRDLYSLVHLLDEDTFDRAAFFESLLQANAPLLRARDAVLRADPDGEALSEALQEASEHALLKSSLQLRSVIRDVRSCDDLSDPEFRSRLAYRLDRTNLLGQVVTRTRKREVMEWRVIREPRDELIRMSPAEANFYQGVTEVVRTYASKSDAHEAFLAVMPQRQMASSMPAALESWRQRASSLEEQAYEDIGFEDTMGEPGPLTQELIGKARNLGDLEELRASDSKYARLRHLLGQFFDEHPVEKVLIFSYFRATLRYLLKRLEADGITCFLLMGGVDSKDQIVDQYREYQQSAVLLSSEVGSEGIDLQFGWVIINYDLPWNPMKVEQRIGRVDRLGQLSPKVLIWNLVYAGTIDARIHQRLLRRLRIFEQSLGGLEPILAERVRELAVVLLSNHLTPDEEAARIDQTAQAVETRRQQEEDLEGEAAHLVAYGDYITRQVHEARDLRRSIGADDLRTYIIDFLELNYPGCTIRQHDTERQRFDIGLSPSAKTDLEAFIRESGKRDLTRLTKASVAPVPCVFENTAVDTSRRGPEVISQFHPIARFVGHEINKRGQHIYPAAAIRVSRSHPQLNLDLGPYVFSVQLWSIEGVRSTEVLHFAAAPLMETSRPIVGSVAERLIVEAALHGTDWIGHSGMADHDLTVKILDEVCLASSDQDFDDYVKQVHAENHDRAELMHRSVDQHWERQRQSIVDVLETHRRKGRDGLVRATMGRLRALEGRVEQRRVEIERRRKLSSRNTEVAVGLINLD